MTCAFEERFCATKMRAEWTKRGNQLFRLFRGCSEHPSPEEATEEANCVASSVNNEKEKDCRLSCDSFGCNSENDIFELFSSGKVTTCKTCNNSQECLEGISDASECPEFATAGCYVGTNWQGQDEYQIYRQVIILNSVSRRTNLKDVSICNSENVRTNKVKYNPISSMEK